MTRCPALALLAAMLCTAAVSSPASEFALNRLHVPAGAMPGPAEGCRWSRSVIDASREKATAWGGLRVVKSSVSYSCAKAAATSPAKELLAVRVDLAELDAPRKMVRLWREAIEKDKSLERSTTRVAGTTEHHYVPRKAPARPSCFLLFSRRRVAVRVWAQSLEGGEQHRRVAREVAGLLRARIEEIGRAGSHQTRPAPRGTGWCPFAEHGFWIAFPEGWKHRQRSGSGMVAQSYEKHKNAFVEVYAVEIGQATPEEAANRLEKLLKKEMPKVFARRSEDSAYALGCGTAGRFRKYNGRAGGTTVTARAVFAAQGKRAWAAFGIYVDRHSEAFKPLVSSVVRSLRLKAPARAPAKTPARAPARATGKTGGVETATEDRKASQAR